MDRLTVFDKAKEKLFKRNNGVPGGRYYSSSQSVPSCKDVSRCWITAPTSCISASSVSSDLANSRSLRRKLFLCRSSLDLTDCCLASLNRIWDLDTRGLDGQLFEKLVNKSSGAVFCHCKQQSKLWFHKRFALWQQGVFFVLNKRQHAHIDIFLTQFSMTSMREAPYSIVY